MKHPPAALRDGPDEAILRLARALARQAAKEDHEKALNAAKEGNIDDDSR